MHSPLEVKNSSSEYLALLNKEGSMIIYVNKGKDIARPHNVYEVLAGEEKAVNLDLMVGAGKTENLEEVVDMGDVKPIITRTPKEAIVILFDISGSMGSRFFNEPDLIRIGAVKSFFEAFAYRTMAYSFEHVVQLMFFDNKTEVKCTFTEAIQDFNRFIASAKPRGSTLLFDCVFKAVQDLLTFRKQYPDCLLRIMALTDGEDTGSRTPVPVLADMMIQHDIVIDSFAVGANCEGLKKLTFACGGKCYLMRNMQESLKLFEQETVLSLRSRRMEPVDKSANVDTLLEKAATVPFDLADGVHEFKMPDMKSKILTGADLQKQLNSPEEVKRISQNSSLTRIVKEIQKYEANPHPYVSIYPCANISLWKILLLGPKGTPYENGLFQLYASFPAEYPFKAPEIRFITPIYHCNVNKQGRICHSVFDRNYTPALTFRQIIDCVYGLILTPEPEDPLDNVIASFYLADYPQYVTNATKATQDNAFRTIDELTGDLFGKIPDDCERQQKSKAVETWIALAKSFN